MCSVCYDVHLFHIHQNQQHAVLMDQFVIARVLCMKMFGYLSKKKLHDDIVYVGYLEK